MRCKRKQIPYRAIARFGMTSLMQQDNLWNLCRAVERTILLRRQVRLVGVKAWNLPWLGGGAEAARFCGLLQELTGKPEGFCGFGWARSLMVRCFH
jgi:hypothetical protein